MRALVVAAVVASACSHGGARPAPANQAKPAIATTDPLVFLPADSQVVIGVDFKQLTASAIWKEYETRIKAAIESASTAATDEKCYRRFLATERMTLSLQSMDKAKLSAVFVLHVPEAPALLECFAGDKTAKTTISHDGEFVLVRKEGDDKIVGVGAIGADTVLIQLGTHVDAASLRAVIASGAPLRAVPGFMSQFTSVDPGATSWIVAGDGSEMLAAMAASGIHPHGAYARLSITDQLAMVIHLALGSDDEAATMAQALDAQAAGVRAFVGKIDIKSQGKLLVIDAAMTAEHLRQIVAMLGSAD